jgi:phytol kinase
MKAFGLFFLSFITLFLVIDFLQKKVFTRIYWSRKATHIASGLLIYVLPLYMNRNQIFWLAATFVIILTISKWKKILSLHDVERKTLGEVLYPASICVLTLLCLPLHPKVFRISVLILALSDGFAGIIGEAWNFHTVTLFRNRKSLGGAITFFVVTCLIFIAFHGFTMDNFYLVLGTSVFLTGAEFILTFGTDNLILPVLTAIIELSLFA